MSRARRFARRLGDRAVGRGLDRLARRRGDGRHWNDRRADRALESFAAPTRPEWLRADTTFWLGNSRGEAGVRLLTRMLKEDPSDKVREKVTFGLSVSKVPAALTTFSSSMRLPMSSQP